MPIWTARGLLAALDVPPPLVPTLLSNAFGIGVVRHLLSYHPALPPSVRNSIVGALTVPNAGAHAGTQSMGSVLAV